MRRRLGDLDRQYDRHPQALGGWECLAVDEVGGEGAEHCGTRHVDQLDADREHSSSRKGPALADDGQEMDGERSGRPGPGCCGRALDHR